MASSAGEVSITASYADARGDAMPPRAFVPR